MPSPGEPEPNDSVRATLAQALGTHYRIERLLGRGGMGAVYLAHEAGLDRDVAIKVLPPERAATAATLERFRREARTAARLSHPNIVPLHAFGEQGDTAYYVMGYVRGESLAARLRREGPLPEAEVRRITIALAEALQHAHQLGVVHRDVKPDNVLLEESTGRPLLTDFGIARGVQAGGQLTGTGSILGTPDFMSPEQAAGRSDVDARSDVYSLGVTAYAMLSGRLPFEAATPGEALARRLTEDPSPLRPLAPQASEVVAAAIMKCLARDPARRWPDAAALARALVSVATDDDEVPRDLRPMTGHGLLALALAYYGLLARLFAASVPSPGLVLRTAADALPLVAGLFLVLPVLGAIQAQLAGRSAGAALRVAFLEPASWTTWYPRRLRRAGNVWDRLPRSVRRLRLGFGALFAVALGLVAPGWTWAFQWDMSDPRTPELMRDSGLFLPGWLALPLAFACVATVFALTAASLWTWRRLGLDDEDGGLFVGGSLSRRAIWNRPAIAALLAPACDAARADGPTSALPVEVGELWPESEAAPVPRDVAVALARQAAEVAAGHERNAARLRRGFDAQENARLAKRLEALGEAVPGEPADQAQLRELLARQLDLHRDAERQVTEALARRDRVRDRLLALRDEAANPVRLPEVRRVRLERCLAALQDELARDTADTPTATREGTSR